MNFLQMIYPNGIYGLLKRYTIQLKSLLIRSNFKYCHKSVVFEGISKLLGTQFITIQKGCSFQSGLYLTAWPHCGDEVFNPNISIGENCSFGAHNHITCTNRIVIGDGLLTGKWVTITDNSHGKTDYENLCIRPGKRKIISKGPVCIGKNVWIGDKVTILSGVNIGDNSVIGANSVVTHDVPPFTVVAGNPAKILKTVKE